MFSSRIILVRCDFLSVLRVTGMSNGVAHAQSRVGLTGCVKGNVDKTVKVHQIKEFDTK